MQPREQRQRLINTNIFNFYPTHTPPAVKVSQTILLTDSAYTPDWADHPDRPPLSPHLEFAQDSAIAQTAPAVMDAGAYPAIVQAITAHASQESRRLLEMSKNIGYMFRHR